MKRYHPLTRYLMKACVDYINQIDLIDNLIENDTGSHEDKEYLNHSFKELGSLIGEMYKLGLSIEEEGY